MSRIHDDEWLNAWAVSWVAHQLPRDPLHLFDANMFHPVDQALRYTEPLVVPALIGAPFRWLGASPLLTHNLLVLAGFLLTALAMYRLVVHWTGDPWSGILAGALLTFSTAMLTRTAHIQFLHFYALPLAVLALDRLLTGGRARDAAWVGVWVIVAATDLGVSRRARRDHPRRRVHHAGRRLVGTARSRHRRATRRRGRGDGSRARPRDAALPGGGPATQLGRRRRQHRCITADVPQNRGRPALRTMERAVLERMGAERDVPRRRRNRPGRRRIRRAPPPCAARHPADAHRHRLRPVSSSPSAC